MIHKDIYEKYIPRTKDGKIVDSEYYKPNRNILEGFEDEVLSFLPSNKNLKILDIGCGAGQLLYLLKLNGYKNIEGVDIGKEQIELTQNLGIKATHIKDLKNFLQKNISNWDIIILSQVIEHFPKDKVVSYLKAIYNALKGNGMVIILTPNMQILTGLYQRYINFTHEVGFSERSLYKVLEVAGFKNIKIYGDKLKIRLRPKFLVWYLLRNIWFKILRFIFILEKGIDAPKILSRDLIAIATKE